MSASTETVRRHATVRGPQWHPKAGQLRRRGKVIKPYRYHAVNQQLLLNTFQDVTWAPHINDPLPNHPSIGRIPLSFSTTSAVIYYHP
jgi:hypothetical protein